MELSFDELVLAVKGEILVDNENRNFNNVNTDTKKNEKDNVFIALKGENFNEFSKIYINGKYTKTVFIDSNTLMINNSNIEPNSSIVVTQRTTGGGKLGSTNEFIYPIVAEQ